MKQPIRNVVFDLGGVLVDLEMEQVREAFRAIGMPRMADLMDPCYPAEVNERMESGAIDFHAACDEMRRIDRRPEVTDRQIYDVYAAFLARIDPEKLRAIDRLRAGGIRTYILSNTNPAAFEIIRNLFAAQGRRMEDAFDGIGLSFRMKLLKPSPAIFERLLTEYGIRPEESLYIDDGARNTATAESLGFNVFCLPTNGHFEAVTDALLQQP